VTVTTLGEIAGVTGGRLVNAGPATAVTGPVAAALSDRDTGRPGVVVDDVAGMLAKLAHVHTGRLDTLTVVGVTGSAGTIWARDYIAQVLGGLGETVSGDELGYAGTALQATPLTRFLVLELPAPGVGHVAYLTGVVAPHIGVVLGSDDYMTSRAHGELAECLIPGGLAVLNADDPLVARMASRARAQSRVVTFGESAAADIRAEDVTLDGRERASYSMVTPHGSVAVRLNVPGRHQVPRALAAAAVALEAGMPVDRLGVALGGLTARRVQMSQVADALGAAAGEVGP
jgi:UDP-N-acetylmuramoyl-tripeptide--D-alanyl-D-alanine ligase